MPGAVVFGRHVYDTCCFPLVLQLVSLQNPCTLRLDGLALSCVTQDVLRHLSASELQRGPASDRISALASHVLGQRRYGGTIATCLMHAC